MRLLTGEAMDGPHPDSSCTFCKQSASSASNRSITYGTDHHGAPVSDMSAYLTLYDRCYSNRYPCSG